MRIESNDIISIEDDDINYVHQVRIMRRIEEVPRHNLSSDTEWIVGLESTSVQIWGTKSTSGIFYVGRSCATSGDHDNGNAITVSGFALLCAVRPAVGQQVQATYFRTRSTSTCKYL